MSIRIDGTNTTANPGITGGDADTGLQFGTDEIQFVTGGTNRATVESNGNFTIENGNLVLASGSGIDFSATGDGPNMTSELLDDYEEGTWTPTEKNSIPLTVSFAKYIKIGSLVTCEVDITYAVNSNPNDTAITLPFAMGNASEYGNGISAWSENGDGVKIHVSSNFAFLMKLETGSNFGNANLTGAAMTNNRFLATFTYRTA